jgi:hypothetical protein
VLSILIAAVALASCTYSVRYIYKDEEKKTAERAAAMFHAQMNAEQYEQIYDNAHLILKNASRKPEFVAALKEAREATGKILEVTYHWENVLIRSPIEVRGIYNIKCEKGDFEEWFAFVISDDGRDALLFNYHIQPGSVSPSELEKVIK